MNDPEPILEETRNTLDRQINEIRDQRNQALKVLRMYFAVAAIIIAAFTTLITTSVSFPFQLDVGGGRIKAPLIVTFGLLMIARGTITFYRGIYNALEVLAVESVDRHPYLRLIRGVFSWIRGKDWPERESYRADLVPDFKNIKEKDNPTIELVDENISLIETNTQTIEKNNNHLRKVFQMMSIGVTGFGIGLVALFLAL